MKKILTSFVLLFFFSKASTAQFELKSNPIALLFSAPNISAEYGISDEFGLEIYGFVVPDGFGIAYLSGKFYLNSRLGLDRFNFGGFLAGGSGVLGAGLSLIHI